MTALDGPCHPLRVGLGTSTIPLIAIVGTHPFASVILLADIDYGTAQSKTDPATDGPDHDAGGLGALRADCLVLHLRNCRRVTSTSTVRSYRFSIKSPTRKG
jgi:hypothetical protein